MTFDAHKFGLVVGVVGTGSMGRGIIQVSAQGGCNVVCYDEKAGAAEAAKAAIAKVLSGLAEKGRISKADANAAVARITIAAGLDEVAKAWRLERVYKPNLAMEKVEAHVQRWHDAVAKA